MKNEYIIRDLKITEMLTKGSPDYCFCGKFDPDLPSLFHTRTIQYKCPECIDRNSSTIEINPKWICVKEKEPPKDRPFLAFTTGRVEMMEWSEVLGWFHFFCSCACCNGYCSDEFDFWMPLPECPKPYSWPS